MKRLTATLQTELLKLKSSKVFIITLGLFVFIPLTMGLLMYVAQHPEFEAKLGLVGAKAAFFKENTWQAFFDVLNQIVAIVGLIGFGFVTTWVFGREYAEHTIKDLLALPVSRNLIVISKFIIVLAWCLLLTITMFVISLVIGSLIHIPELSGEILWMAGIKFLSISLLTLLLMPSVALIVSVSRSVFFAVGFVFLTVIISQFVALSGLGAYFPWSIPGVFSVSGSVEGFKLVGFSYAIVLLTGLNFFYATLWWWNMADQK